MIKHIAIFIKATENERRKKNGKITKEKKKRQKNDGWKMAIRKNHQIFL